MKTKMSIPYLSWKSMKYNRQKTVFLILTVSLAVCLMTVFWQYLYSSRQRSAEIAALEAGAYHAEYGNLSNWQLSRLNNCKAIREVMPVQSKDGVDYVKIILKSNINCKNTLRDIENKYGIQENQIQWNIPYLDSINIGIEEILQAFCIIAGLIFVSGIVVYNIYNIYMIQNIQILGAMKAAGFDSRQLKLFLKTESIIIGITGSLAGIISGECVSFLLIPMLGNAENISVGLKVRTTPGIAVLSFAVGVLIVLLGIQKPVKTAAEKSVIEMIRYVPAYNPWRAGRKDNGKKRITLWDFCKINLNRNQKRNRWVVLSLTVTGVLFLVTASIIDSMNIENLLKLTIQGDYSIGLKDEAGRNKKSGIRLDEHILEELQKQDGIEELHPIMYDRLLWTEEDAKKYARITEEFRELGIGYEDMDSIIYGYDDAYMERCLQLTGNEISLEDIKEQDYIILVQKGISEFHAGDTIHFQIDNGASGDVIEFKIAGVLKNNITYRGYSGAGNDFILHQKRFEAFNLDSRIQRVSVTVKETEKENVGSYLEKLTENNQNMELESFDEQKEEYTAQKEALERGSYSVLIFLFCISAVNLINTSLSNILSQKRELGILEAIGMTRGQESRLLQMESAALTFSGGAIACLIGIPLGYMGFCLFRQSASYAVYKAPVMQCFLLMMGYIVIQGLIAAMIQYGLDKISITDKIRQ
ncbi:ABC transporter permease [Candidatus Merdisoma sp. JLR.KK006]|uniref:ABC transporter permease n=1 Tax=Candidatus Merdisoma sp. JLR.KK006 TaxID=3112626 RepID=UPI002FF1127A